MKNYSKFLFYVFLFFITNPLISYSSTIIINSPEDTYIEGSTISGNNNNTYGSSAFLNAYTNSHLWGNSLIKFPNLFGSNPNQIPLNATILTAELHLWLDISWGNENNTLSLYQLITDWDENSVSSNSFGKVTPTLNALALPVDTLQGPSQIIYTDEKFVFNVKGSVENWFTQGNNFGWGLTSTGPQNQFFSSENPNIQRQPTLVINYSTVPEPATMILFGLSILGIAGIRKNKILK